MKKAKNDYPILDIDNYLYQIIFNYFLNNLFL